MPIIAGHVAVEAKKRDAYVAAFRDMVQRSRAFEGCLDPAITADLFDTTRVDNFELWASEASLENGRKVAKAPDVAFRDADVKKYEISAVGAPF